MPAPGDRRFIGTRSPGHAGAFVGEQPSLALDAAAVAGERAVGADDAVAGHNDADGIVAIGMAGGAYRRLAADPASEVGIADGRSAGDCAQGLPDPALEVGAAGCDRKLI